MPAKTPKPSLSGAALVAALCKKYKLGHPEIDAQHRRIFEIVALADEGRPAVDILRDLFAYAGDHFMAEERIAQDSNVLVEEHVQAHHALLDKIAACKCKTVELNPLVRQFLVDWVTAHIDKEDRELVQNINLGRRLQGRTEDDA